MCYFLFEQSSTPLSEDHATVLNTVGRVGITFIGGKGKTDSFVACSNRLAIDHGGGEGSIHGLACFSRRPLTSNPYEVGTEHAGFPADHARSQLPTAKRRGVFGGSHGGGGDTKSAYDIPRTGDIPHN